MSKKTILLFCGLLLFTGAGLAQTVSNEMPRKEMQLPPPPPPPPPPPMTEEERKMFRIEPEEYPLVEGCEASEDTDIMQDCLEGKMLDFIKREFSYSLSFEDVLRNEEIEIRYAFGIGCGYGIRKIELSPIHNPKVEKELRRVLELMNKNHCQLLIKRKGNRYRKRGVWLEHILEVNEELLK